MLFGPAARLGPGRSVLVNVYEAVDLGKTHTDSS